MTTKTTPTNAVKAVFEDPYLQESILQIAQDLLAKEMCKKIYIPWKKIDDYLTLQTTCSEESKDIHNTIYHKRPKEKNWFFSLQPESYWETGLQHVLLCDTEHFNKYLLWSKTLVWQSNEFQDQRRAFKKDTLFSQEGS